MNRYYAVCQYCDSVIEDRELEIVYEELCDCCGGEMPEYDIYQCPYCKKRFTLEDIKTCDRQLSLF
jgi:hypothetical protein